MKISRIPVREKVIEKRLKEKIEKLGGQCPKFVSPGSAGWPDRIALVPGGKIYLVEVKNDKGRISPLQKIRHRELLKLGITVHLVWSHEDVDVFIELIKSEMPL